MLGLVYKLVLSGPGFWVGSEFKQVNILCAYYYARSCVVSTRTLKRESQLPTIICKKPLGSTLWCMRGIIWGGHWADNKSIILIS